MSIKYTVIQKANPRKPQEKKWYANAKADGEISFKSLSQELSEMSTTVSDTDVLAVLNDLTKLLSRHLAEGKIVRFGEFGSFQVSLSSNGEAEESKVTAAAIKSTKIQFRPGEDLKAMLKTAKFEKYGKK